MKRLVVLLLIAFYLVTSIGMTVSRFYCCGVLQSTEISFNASPDRACRFDSTIPDCCKTLKSSIKLKDRHLSSASDLFGPHINLASPVLYACTYRFLCPGTIIPPAYAISDPPGIGLDPIYLFTCTYRI